MSFEKEHFTSKWLFSLLWTILEFANFLRQMMQSSWKLMKTLLTSWTLYTIKNESVCQSCDNPKILIMLVWGPLCLYNNCIFQVISADSCSNCLISVTPFIHGSSRKMSPSAVTTESCCQPPNPLQGMRPYFFLSVPSTLQWFLASFTILSAPTDWSLLKIFWPWSSYQITWKEHICCSQ